MQRSLPQNLKGVVCTVVSQLGHKGGHIGAVIKCVEQNIVQIARKRLDVYSGVVVALQNSWFSVKVYENLLDFYVLKKLSNLNNNVKFMYLK